MQWLDTEFWTKVKTSMNQAFADLVPKYIDSDPLIEHIVTKCTAYLYLR